jgi:hypothetical protein
VGQEVNADQCKSTQVEVVRQEVNAAVTVPARAGTAKAEDDMWGLFG